MIWRSLSWDELVAADAGTLPLLHGFIWQPRGVDDRNTAQDLHEDGLKALTYFNVLNGPCPEWHSPYLDFVRENVPMIPGAVFPWFRCESSGRQIIAWWDVTPQTMQRMAQLMESESFAGAGFFLDQFWSEPQWWMFSPEGIPFSDITPTQIEGWRIRIQTFRDIFLRPRVEDVYTNGSWDDYTKLYLENTQGRWKEAQLQMERSPLHIAACDPRFEQHLSHLGRLVASHRVALSGPDDGAVAQGYYLLEGHWQALTAPTS